MLNLTSFKKVFYVSVFALFVSCGKGDSGEPQVQATIASNLAYSPSMLELESGVAGTSVKPSISGTSPITYSISTSPDNNGAITIDSEGKIKAAATLAVGTYAVSVTAVNAAGSASFPSVYTVKVNASVPSVPLNLTYSPNSSTVTQGTAVTSAVPTISSSSAVTYSVSSSPASAAITINNQGVISATSALTAGTYLVNVTATNSVGNKAFTNVYTITVNAATTGSTTYNNHIKAIIQSSCGSCHINGGQVELGTYTTAKNHIDGILTRIKLAQGAPGMMPSGGTKLSQETINLIQKWKDDGLLQ